MNERRCGFLKEDRVHLSKKIYIKQRRKRKTTAHLNLRVLQIWRQNSAVHIHLSVFYKLQNLYRSFLHEWKKRSSLNIINDKISGLYVQKTGDRRKNKDCWMILCSLVANHNNSHKVLPSACLFKTFRYKNIHIFAKNQQQWEQLCRVTDFFIVLFFLCIIVFLRHLQNISTRLVDENKKHLFFTFFYVNLS